MEMKKIRNTSYLFITFCSFLIYVIIVGEDKTIYKCPPDETVLFLKELIEEEEGVKPWRQFLYKDGYWIDSDDYKLSDFLENKDELELCLGTAAPPTRFENKSANPHWVINGTKRNFTLHLLEPRELTRIKLKSQYFGVVYHKTGKLPGTREFQVKRFSVKQSDKVELKYDGNDKTEVYINGEMKEVDEQTVYKETQNKGVKTNISKIALNIKEHSTFLSSWVFRGKESRFCQAQLQLQPQLSWKLR